MVTRTMIRASVLPVALLLFLPHYCFAHQLFLDAQIQLRAAIVSFLNLALFITALISIKQYFWPGDNNTMPFHYFNIVFTILFYAVSLPFLITNRQYYEEYAQLIPLSVLNKFFLSINISSFAQWVIIAAVVVNILYIKRFRRDYYEAGIASGKSEPINVPAPVAEYPGVNVPLVHAPTELVHTATEDTHFDDSPVRTDNQTGDYDTDTLDKH